MDGQPAAANSKHHYPTQLWTRSISSSGVPRLETVQTAAQPAEAASTQCATHLELVPILFPHQSVYQAQLLQYNKLIAPPGRAVGLQTSPLPPVLSSQAVHAGARSRSSSKVLNKDSRHRQSSQNCHGNRTTQSTHKPDRLLMTGKGANPKMSAKKKTDGTQALAQKPKTTMASSSHLPPHSSSVPSTPHQHARKFSYESRDQSPGANTGHSPRSVYSETNTNVPSLRPLPARGGGCKYETGLKHMKRRVPYTGGSDPLDRIDLSLVSNKLSEDDERKLSTDMRELYNRLKPTQAVEIKRKKLVRKLAKLLNDAWPGHDITVHLFGSSGNLLCSDDSDVDICIVTPWKELEGVCMLADLLAKHGMEKVVCVASAKVPIVKIWDPELELSCDMNVNNTLALENTRMMRTYVEIDERVRPFAMIVKYWTRRRVLNDAAFGGTLSSYTWMCMIIAFLQLRQPPVLPALHQRPHQQLPRKEGGGMAAFADDVESLRGFGDGNKSSLGELLFQFFRFFAHEFDYFRYVLSVRLGKLMVKDEKPIMWKQHPLGVEEPFNTHRNLGNTADDYSFRGIHIELRRAFDCIAQGNLEECCEQYVFPKEEERIFQKPAPVSRPVLLRSASQHGSRSSRGGGGTYRGGGRHQNRNNNGHNNNSATSRRASSGLAFDNPQQAMYMPHAYPMAIGGQDGNGMYIQAPELAAHLSALQLQENNLRFLQYTHSQAFAQQQVLHAQRMQGSTSQPQTSTDRSRTNSFDNAPLTAPLRQDVRSEIYYYPIPFPHPQPLYGVAPYAAMTSNGAGADYRRPSHRSTNTSDASLASSGSTIRSQSQPASRPVAVPQGHGLVVSSAMPNGFPNASTHHVHGMGSPSFIPDEGNENERISSAVNSADEGKTAHYYTNPSSPRIASSVINGMPAFGDVSSHSGTSDRRRLSSDEFTSGVPTRTASRSRSTSPIDGGNAYSQHLGSAPPSSTALSPRYLARETAPIVVNGSVSTPQSSPGQGWHGEAMMPADLPVPIYENPLHVQEDSSQVPPQAAPSSENHATPRHPTAPVSNQPVVVNGTTHPSGYSTPPLHGHLYTHDAVALNPEGVLKVASWPVGMVPAASGGHAVRQPAPHPQRFPRTAPSPLIEQLDLATAPSLSPVYEAKSSSPHLGRKLDTASGEGPSRLTHASQKRRNSAIAEHSRVKPKPLVDSPNLEADVPPHSNTRINGLVRESGHVRGAKSDTDNTAAHSPWQKPRGRKRVADLKGRGEAFTQSEQPPKNEADRKGG
ncbi:hypothetical protein F5Y17DRAFT_454830 [Xylariaceae sp. FL0594]|nr:hypothetical protein F5Y17DRAFT_454830 [Xylariaceae sp. FL0594]